MAMPKWPMAELWRNGLVCTSPYHALAIALHLTTQGAAGCFAQPDGVGGRMGEFSIWHWLLVLAIALLLFGPKRLPEIGKGIGEGLKALKEGMKEASAPKSDTKPDTKPEQKT